MTEELDAQEIYRILLADKKYILSHVNRKNVDELITIAQTMGNKILESRLRDWK